MRVIPGYISLCVLQWLQSLGTVFEDTYWMPKTKVMDPIDTVFICTMFSFPVCCYDKNTLTKRNYGRKDLLGLHFHATAHRLGSQGRNSSRNLNQKPWRNVVWGSWLANFLRKLRTTYQERVLPTVDYQLRTKTIEILFSDDSSCVKMIVKGD